MLSHLLTNFEIQIYENKFWFKGAYLRNNLLKNMKNGAYVVYLDEMLILELTGLLFYVRDVYSDSFGVQHFSMKFKNS